jgi:hypothetical protein
VSRLLEPHRHGSQHGEIGPGEVRHRARAPDSDRRAPGQTSSTGHDAWSTTNRLAEPRLRYARQAPFDRVCRQAWLSIFQPYDLRTVPRCALGRDKRKHIRRGHLRRKSLPITVKNTFKSNPMASSVFGRTRAATNSRYRSIRDGRAAPRGRRPHCRHHVPSPDATGTWVRPCANAALRGDRDGWDTPPRPGDPSSCDTAQIWWTRGPSAGCQSNSAVTSKPPSGRG